MKKNRMALFTMVTDPKFTSKKQYQAMKKLHLREKGDCLRIVSGNFPTAYNDYTFTEIVDTFMKQFGDAADWDIQMFFFNEDWTTNAE